MHPSSDDFRPFLGNPNDHTPGHINDYLLTDIPVLGLHVISFTNATIVSLTWPHTMSDALGMLALVTNWCKVLEGREDEISPLLGVTVDPLDTVGTGELHPSEVARPYAFRDKVLTGWGLARFMIRFIWEVFWHPRHTQRIICLPPQALTALRAEATRDLTIARREQDGEEKSLSPPFVSDGDILMAFLTRIASRTSPSPRPVAFRNAFELRSRLPAVFDASASYIANYILLATTQLSADEALTLPLGQLALRYRNSLLDSLDESQIRGWLRYMRYVPGKLKMALDPASIMFNCSNWTKAKFFYKVDFSSAIIRRGSIDSKVETAGKPVYFQCMMVKTTPKTLRNMFNILGRDLQGNYWISMTLAPKAWPGVEEELAKVNTE